AAGFVANSNGSIAVKGSHTYTQPGSYTIAVVIYVGGGGQANATATITVAPTTDNLTDLSGGSFGAPVGDPTFDPNGNHSAGALPTGPSQFLTSVGEADVAPNTGGLRLSIPLDFDLSPGTAVGGSPALVYNSDTVSACVTRDNVGRLRW